MMMISKRCLNLWLLLMIIFAAGCSRSPKVTSPVGLELIKALYTACSSKNMERLAKVTSALETAKEKGEVSEAEFVEFSRIIELAKSGQWTTAADASWAFAKAQTKW